MTDDEQVCEVVITADDPAWLAAFTRRLVERRLAACGQNVTEVRSTYRWNGEVEEAREARAALHTRRSLLPQIVAVANSDHPYDVPCVIAVPVLDGNPAYLAWVLAETAGPPGSTL